MAITLPEFQVYVDEFNAADKNENGSLEDDEMTALVEALQLGLDESQLEEFKRTADLDQDGRVTLFEFISKVQGVGWLDLIAAEERKPIESLLHASIKRLPVQAELPLLRHISGEGHQTAVHALSRSPSEVSTSLVKSQDFVTDTTALGLLVADALKNKGWGKVDRSSITVKDNSGYGGSKTFKVSATGVDVTPATVALHSRVEASTDDPITESRIEAAALLFSKHGMGVKRLAHGVDWYLEPWEGYGEPVLITKEDMVVFAGEVAKIHQMPTNWYNPFRAQQKEQNPGLAAAPDGSHIWWYFLSSDWRAWLGNNSNIDQEQLVEYAQPLFTPQTQAAKGEQGRPT